MTYTDAQVIDLLEGRARLDREHLALMEKFLTLSLSAEAMCFVRYGFTRRIGTLKRCIVNVYAMCPPDQSTPLASELLADVNINLQGLIFNLFGALDNLAWIWVIENKLTRKSKKGLAAPLDKAEIGLMDGSKNRIVRETFSLPFRRHLESLDAWFDYLRGCRHALAHQIPLYVPPFGVSTRNFAEYNALEARMSDALLAGDPVEWDRLNDDQRRLGFFLPFMAYRHNGVDKSINFHPQLLADWATILKIGGDFVEELMRRRTAVSV